MATQLKKVVAPSGGDYTSLEACMNANEQNLVTADRYFDVEISGSWSSADTTAVTIHNYTTDATRYINIYTTGDARHDGRMASVSGRSNYILKPTFSANGNCINTPTDVTLDGLEISATTNNYQVYGINQNIVARPLTSQVRNNIVHDIATTGGAIGIFSQNGASVINNIIYNIGQDNSYGTPCIQQTNIYVAGSVVSNNTCYQKYTNTRGFYSVTSTSTNNLIILANSFDGYAGAGGTTNAASDGTGTSASLDYLTTAVFASVSANAEDLSLVVGSAPIDAGTTLSYAYGIKGNDRSGTWDIGADEYVSAVVATIKRRMLMGAGV